MDGAHGLFIDGCWREARHGSTLALVDPATEEELGTIPVATPGDLDDALGAAQRGFSTWRHVPARERGGLLIRIAERIRAEAEELARVVTREMGKPLAEAHAEVQATADQFEWNGEEAKRIYGRLLEGGGPEARLAVRFEPLGVVAAFTPWNFPALLPARKIAAALAAGCSLVVKPSEEAPGAAFGLTEITRQLGLPAGVLNIVTGEPRAISSHLIGSPIVRKVTFTGSVPVGKQLMQLAAAGLKRVSLELGGHAPVLVFGDVDPVAVATACARAKFRNAGQVCISPSRFYVQRAQLAPFCEAFAARARDLKLGPGTEPGVEMGPLANRRRAEAARMLVEDATARGAKLLAGGGRPAWASRGHFFSPTVLSEVPPEARILHEEPFVPVAPILGFDAFDEVVERANGLPFGLAAYVFTNHLGTAQRAAEALEAGMVGINDFALASPDAPFGGVKESGMGRESGWLGVREFLEAKTVKTVI